MDKFLVSYTYENEDNKCNNWENTATTYVNLLAWFLYIVSA